MNDRVSIQDLAAMFVSILLTIGLIYLAVLSREIPPSLTMALGSSTTWLFIRATNPPMRMQATNVPSAAGAAQDAYYAFPAKDSEPLSKP